MSKAFGHTFAFIFVGQQPTAEPSAGRAAHHAQIEMRGVVAKVWNRLRRCLQPVPFLEAYLKSDFVKDFALSMATKSILLYPVPPAFQPDGWRGRTITGQYSARLLTEIFVGRSSPRPRRPAGVSPTGFPVRSSRFASFRPKPFGPDVDRFWRSTLTPICLVAGSKGTSYFLPPQVPGVCILVTELPDDSASRLRPARRSRLRRSGPFCFHPVRPARSVGGV